VLLLELVDVELDVPGQRVAGGQVLVLHHHRTARTVELDDPHPVGIEREIELLARADRKMDLARIAFTDQAAPLVGLARIAQIVAAAVAAPPLRLQVDVEIFGDPDLHRTRSEIHA